MIVCGEGTALGCKRELRGIFQVVQVKEAHKRKRGVPFCLQCAKRLGVK